MPIFAGLKKNTLFLLVRAHYLAFLFFSTLGYDVIAQAQSGTGKTATFAISILQQVDIELKGSQALILAPTRELAQQVSAVSAHCFWVGLYDYVLGMGEISVVFLSKYIIIKMEVLTWKCKASM